MVSYKFNDEMHEIKLIVTRKNTFSQEEKDKTNYSTPGMRLSVKKRNDVHDYGKHTHFET